MNTLKKTLIDFAVDHSRWVAFGLLAVTLVFGSFFPNMTMDTDPENLLERDEPARVFHNAAKQRFDLSETIVVGVVKEDDPDGVFNPRTLAHVYELTEFAKTLRYEDPDNPGRSTGVVEVDMVAPSVVDHMRQAGPGSIAFEWLMPRPPATRAEALAVRDKALSNPLLVGQMVSRDGKALCLYLPLTDKLLSYKVYTALQDRIRAFHGEEYHIAGLPVAEGAIGVEMFSEMTIASPLAMALIFGLLIVMFRKWVLVVLPMAIATAVVVAALGSMIACGFPVHILSSMLPIFLMSISICDCIHILSEFFDIYTPEKGRRASIKQAMHTLFMPMLYTSLTTSAGFFSFLGTDIPPARVFGAFIGIGVMYAWIITILFVPAYIMLIPQRMLHGFGLASREDSRQTLLTRILHRTGQLTVRHARTVLVLCAVAIALSAWGMSTIRVNDNYAKRFAVGHPIRTADTVLNRHFGGSYTASLILETGPEGKPTGADVERIAAALAGAADGMANPHGNAADLADQIAGQIASLSTTAASVDDLLATAIQHVDTQRGLSPPEKSEIWQELRSCLETEREKNRTFKRPDVLAYMVGLQDHLTGQGFIGKSTSLADIVRKVHQELVDGDPANYRIPQSPQAVSECVMQYQQGHKPDSIWHYVTPDFTAANVFMQFPSGDSLRTEAAVKEVRAYMANHQPPVPLSAKWAGLHYVNYVFQGKMFWGMLYSLAGSFIIVLVMMAGLFRSLRWGLLCMVPLSLTILSIYGALGFLGLDFDMPVAVLGAISLGIAVDFAIHFLERSRQMLPEAGSWPATAPRMFGEPARAISRNVIIIAIGFLPMLIASLAPYKTTGLLLFSILSMAGIVTLVVLPAILTAAQSWFFGAAPNSQTVRPREDDSPAAGSPPQPAAVPTAAHGDAK